MAAAAVVVMEDNITISPEQAGKMLGRDRKFIVQLILAGELDATDERRPGAKIPRYRINPRAVVEWRQSRMVIPPESTQRQTALVPLVSTVRERLERMRTRQGRERVPA